jgi:pimeloyl-ACP methyl ester carboxylesterase
MKRKLLHISDVDIAYYDTEESRPAIVFIHGNSHSSQSFQNQFNSKLAEAFRILAIDLAGHGSSGIAHDQEIYSLPYHANILCSFVNELKLENAFFAGHSLGGHIILEAAPHLKSLSGIIIWGTPPIGNPPELAKCFQPTPDAAGFFMGELSEEMARAMCKSMYADKYHNYEQFMGDVLSTDPMARVSVAKSLQELNFSDEINILANLKCPIAIFHGEEEKVIDGKYFDLLNLNNIWTERVIKIPNAGHSPHVENVEFFNETIGRFCQSALLKFNQPEVVVSAHEQC